MDYELAEQLKDAGFPQGGKGRWVGSPDKIVLRNGDRVYVPTLEELIEACERDGYFNFEIGHLQSWMAKIIENSTTKTLVESSLIAHGSTPTDAVARLWLALHAHGDATA